MRLVTYEVSTVLGPVRRSGALIEGDAVVDLQLAHQAAGGGAHELPADLLELLRGGDRALERARAAVQDVVDEGREDHAGGRLRHEAGSVRLRSPLPRPNSLRDFMVVEEHVVRSLGSDRVPEEWWNIPVYYKGNVDEIYGPDDVVPWPAYTDKLDYELEVGAVVGRPGRRVAAEDAAAHIVGYTLYNDWSARDIQFREMSVGIGPGYGKDFASSLGPCIVTADEFDRDAARLTATIDGEVWSEGVLGTMHFSFEQIIEWISREQTIHPGDVLGSGTVGGGCGLELDRWLQEGSVVELEAEGLGVLRNRVGRKGRGTEHPDAAAQEEGLHV